MPGDKEPRAWQKIFKKVLLGLYREWREYYTWADKVGTVMVFLLLAAIFCICVLAIGVLLLELIL